jgi:hypothetical protein
MMLGYTAAHTESLAMAVIVSKVKTNHRKINLFIGLNLGY